VDNTVSIHPSKRLSPTAQISAPMAEDSQSISADDIADDDEKLKEKVKLLVRKNSITPGETYSFNTGRLECYSRQ
jgi:hypothetical protein